MLRITVMAHHDHTRLAIEGRLAGPWVDELMECWRALRGTSHARLIRVDLDAVTFIDAAGAAVLRDMHAHGAVLEARGCMTRAVVEGIEREVRERMAQWRIAKD